ncbi:hypothetical protein N7533_012604 [Penicillium manginii]|jgi:hypothetical protein|uniref:uncharacterized protein n=1 Tax=Penicillium manginii TaxID=203109 RepID=UPI002547A547|nr:uncharacterized protein N7533_012604 [Penicillium manginii]KAJ5739820.1 hypothetical protein N7533_012604 [Penicillium manginii]
MVSFTKLFTAGLMATSALAAPVKKRSTSKRGAAYNDVSTVSAMTSSGNVAWAYNWAMSLSGDLPTGIDFVPMLWGAKDFGGWVTAIETALSSGSEYILGFNEPDIASQADMSASDAASYYMNYITPYSGKAKLISPAVSSSTNEGQGLSWFNSFMSQCSSCQITGLAVHWYGTTIDEFKTFVQQAITAASDNSLSEVWITEFALSADAGGIADQATTNAFITEAIAYLDSESAVTRYSYFMSADNYLLTNGALNTVGETYCN